MDQFDEWWGKGKGSEQWSRTIDKDILGAIKMAFNSGVMSEKNRGQALTEKLDGYIAFLGRANQGPISLAHVHGWRCPQEDIETGERLRKEIEALRI